MQTPEGTETYKQTMYKKYGGKEGFSERMKIVGAIGGRSGKAQGTKKGFSLDRERARLAGQKGGSRSSRLGIRNKDSVA